MQKDNINEKIRNHSERFNHALGFEMKVWRDILLKKVHIC